MTRLRCAILDDYLNLALRVADWSKVSDRVDVTVFNQPFASREAAASALKDFEIICAMRERTPFPRALFAALPKLKLLITSGMRNAAIDMEAAKDASGGAVRHAMWPRSHRGADHGPDPGTDPQYRPRERAHACRRTVAEIRRHRDRGPDAGRRRPRQARHQGFGAGEGVRHERDRLEPEPDAGAMQGGRRRLRHQGRIVRHRRHHHHPCGAEPALARTGRARPIWRA